MQEQFIKHIKTRFPFIISSKLLLAISGGVDSVVLAHLCVESGLDIALAHCNFNLRGAESDGDERFVRDLAKKLDVTVYVEHFDTRSYLGKDNASLQMVARKLRYDWFGKLAETLKFDYVLTAHQADDSLETFLINLSRGTGLEGLTGIPEVNGIYIRPLLFFSREIILNFAGQHKINWRDDSSNSETKYLRNKLRLKVIPELKELNPNFLDNFQNTVHHLQGSSQILKQHIAEIKRSVFTFQGEELKILVSDLVKLQPRKDYLFELFKEFGFTEWNDVEQLLFAMSGKQVVSQTHRMLKNREELIITPIKPIEMVGFYEWDFKQNTVLNHCFLRCYDVEKIEEVTSGIAYLDKDLLKNKLIVRKWQKGDYFYPIGMENKKKLSKFFKDEKLSVIDKENVWLLCSGEDIVWVINHRIDNRFKVTSNTKNILKIEYKT